MRNEEQFLPGFVERVNRLELPEGIELGMIFVEDSSTDGTVALLRTLCAARPRVSYYRLRKGYGQCAAIAFGLRSSDADAVIMMDADGEHPPEVIPEMLRHYLEGADAVQCVRRSRDIKQGWRRAGTAAFNALALVFTGVKLDEQNVYFRLVTRDFLGELIADNKWLRFLRIGAHHGRGRNMARVPFDAVTIAERQSTYGPGRLIRLAVDALLSLVSGVRLCILVALALVLGVYLAAKGLAVIAMLVVGTAGVAAYRYLTMVRGSMLDKLEVEESGP